jgi:hypothetical protein
MSGSSKGMWQRLLSGRGLQAAVVALGVGAGTGNGGGPDSTRHVGGYVGILSVPNEVLQPTNTPVRNDLTQRIPATLRGPGRVLYAPGKAPKPATPAAVPATEAKRTGRVKCPRPITEVSRRDVAPSNTGPTAS